LAEENVKTRKGGPFGAIIVIDGVIVGEGVNRVTTNLDPTAHAEIMAIRAACKHLKSFKLPNSILYSSCEPCPMCLSAAYWAGIEAIYFSNTKSEAAEIGFSDLFLYEEVVKPIDKRSIPTINEPLELAKKVFEAWAEDQNKVEY
jgi:guanine deaminase